MAKERFQATDFKIATRTVIQQATGIINEYAKMGFKLTLRQLYYQFVARDIIANKHSEYKRLGSIINDARLAGHIDWAAIEDRTRNVEFIPAWDNPQAIIRSAARSYQEDLWRDQDNYVEVWIEKEALFGVIERVCQENRLPHFACRGYVSQSEAYSAGKRFAKRQSEGKTVHVLHLGDHDPSGIDMTRDITERVRMFARSNEIVVHRLALNMDQIEEYDPPPNPAKESDIRFRGYQAIHGESSWELDSLDPRVIENLIASEIENLIEPETWAAAIKAEEENKDALETVEDEWGNVTRFLKYRDTFVPYSDDADNLTFLDALAEVAANYGDE